MLDRFGAEERARIGVHSCPGGDHDSTHSADIDYVDLLPQLFDLRAGAFYLELAGQRYPEAVLEAIAANMRPGQTIFVGVIDPIDPRVETAEEARDRVPLAAAHIPLQALETTDDCGFSPFADDRSTARETAFEKIGARVEGTAPRRTRSRPKRDARAWLGVRQGPYSLLRTRAGRGRLRVVG